MAAGEYETPRHRRYDDVVSYRDMVEFFAEHSQKDTAIRSESLIQINRAIEKLEVRFDKTADTLDERFNRHEEYHREVLQKVIDSGKSSRLAVWAMTISFLGVIVSLIIGIIALVKA